MSARCDCCDLPVYSCGKNAETRQRDEDNRRRGLALAVPGAFPARYPGTCEGCGERFEENDVIRWTTGGWRAECCEVAR